MGVQHKLRRLARSAFRPLFPLKRGIPKALFYLICLVLIYHAIIFLVVAGIIVTADFDKDEAFYEGLKEDGHPTHRQVTLSPNTVKTDRYTVDYSAPIPRAERPVNADGFFAYKEYNRTKPDDMTRVVVLGDSFTAGAGVNLSQTYVSRLNGLFNETQLLNFGISGLNTELERIRLERKALAYNPDVVMLQVYENDRYDEGALGYYSSWIRRLLDFTALSLDIPIMDRCVYDVRSLLKYRYHTYVSENEGEVTKRLFTQEIRKIKDLTFRENASLVLLSFQHTQLQKEAIKRLSKHDDVYLINLPEEIAYDTDTPRLRLHENDGHPSPFAHKVVARHVSDRIEHLLK